MNIFNNKFESLVAKVPSNKFNKIPLNNFLMAKDGPRLPNNLSKKYSNISQNNPETPRLFQEKQENDKVSSNEEKTVDPSEEVKKKKEENLKINKAKWRQVDAKNKNGKRRGRKRERIKK